MITTVRKPFFTFRVQLVSFSSFAFYFSPSPLLFLLGICESLKFSCSTSFQPQHPHNVLPSLTDSPLFREQFSGEGLD